jgi:hypothetical protein
MYKDYTRKCIQINMGLLRYIEYSNSNKNNIKYAVMVLSAIHFMLNNRLCYLVFLKHIDDLS